MIPYPAIALLALLLAPPALAHDLWLEKEGNVLVLHQGHKHSSHASSETQPYDAGFVKAALCLDTAGAARTLPAVKGVPWRSSADCPALLLSVSSGYWSKTPWETKNLPRNQVQGALRSWLSEESVKRIDRWTPAAAQPVGDGLEIVPLANPLTLWVEDKLSVRVVEGRKPRAGVTVAYGDDARGTTGADGTIAIRVRHGGVNLISASIETPLADGRADVRIQSATLQFDLPQ